MLTGAPGAPTKHTRKENYYHKRKLFLTFYKLITQFQCINYYIISFLVCLTSEASVNISLILFSCDVKLCYMRSLFIEKYNDMT